MLIYFFFTVVKKMKDFSWLLSSGGRVLVTSLNNNLWTLSQVCKPTVGQGLPSSFVSAKPCGEQASFCSEKNLVLDSSLDVDVFFQYGPLQATENSLFWFSSTFAIFRGRLLL